MMTLWQDLRYGLRVMWKNPGFTAVAVMALALGVGVNTAVFSVANAVLLRPLPYAEPERLVILSQSTPTARQAGFSVADFLDFREQAGSFEHCAAFYTEMVNFGGGAQGTRQVPFSFVTSDFFDTLGVRPALGRNFTPEEDRPGAPQVVIISQRVWREQFGADPRVVGQRVTLDGRPFEVAGVAPEGFHFYENVELWLPLGQWTKKWERSSHYSLSAVARLKDGVTFEQAEAEVETIAARLSQQYPETNAQMGASLTPIYEDTVGGVRPAFRVLILAVGFVLLIACVNVANLLLARATAREREIAVRSALGASRWRIARQLLTESVLLALVGGGLGVLLAVWGVDLVTAAGGADIPRLAEPGALGLDRNVLGFSLLISLVAGLGFGLAPALQATRAELVTALKEGGRGSGASRGRRLRDALVVGEVAMTLVLLVGAGLLVKSLVRLRGVSLGYNPEHVLTVGVSLPRATYKTDADVARFGQSAVESARTLPGVEHLAASYPLPVYGMAWGMFYSVEGEPPPEPGKFPLVQTAAVGPGFFPTMQIPLTQGREFTDADTADSEPVVIVDETLARRHWPGENPVGKRLTVKDDRPRTVVGLAGAVRNFGLADAPHPQIYIPHAQQLADSSPMPFVYLSLRTKGDPEALASAVKARVESVDRDAAISAIRPMDELLDRQVARERFAVLLMEIFAGLALALAAVGLYGVISYSVTQRTQEIGVRMALGAQTRDILRMIVGQGVALTLAGIGVGIAGAFALTRLMSGMLYGVEAHDPLTFASVAALVAAVALLASYVPARRATKVDPMVALRYE